MHKTSPPDSFRAFRGFCFGFACLLAAISTAIAAPKDSAAGSTLLSSGFESHPKGALQSHEDAAGRWEANSSGATIQAGPRRAGKHSLRLAGEPCEVTWTPSRVDAEPYELSFWAERWSSSGPFTFHVEIHDGQAWREVYRGDDAVEVGGFNTQVRIPLHGTMPHRVRFICSSDINRGVLIDDVRISRRLAMAVRSVTDRPTGMPVLIGNRYNPVRHIVVHAPGNVDTVALNNLTLTVNDPGLADAIAFVEVYATGGVSALSWRNPEDIFKNATRVGDAQPAASRMTFAGSIPLVDGENHLWVTYQLKEGSAPNILPEVACESVSYGNGRVVHATAEPMPGQSRASVRVGIALRNTGQDGVASHRIPGLVTTHRGTLIAVYDVRHRGWGDLPGDIDIGMSRSTDGGHTWEPMQIIGDMGDDPAHAYDGVGDPAILVDKTSGTIWVAGLWSHGNRGWKNSGPGITPDETAQLVLYKCDDDGVTWSPPINITPQVKDPAWRMVFQGPGSGITMSDGTLVFAAQFKDAGDMPYATIIYSQDHGQTWKIGTGAKSNTTEAQVVQLHDGALMLNMRDNRGGARSVYVTHDMGQTWEAHRSSRSALPEPVCQASLIRVDVQGLDRPVLLFSNPAVPDKPRRNMTIKASFDGGNTWPEEHHLLIDAGESAGYSSLTMIDKNTVGILYEGSRANMTFMRIPLAEIIGQHD